MPDIPKAPEPNRAYAPRGSTWDALREEATGIRRLTVTAPLSIISTDAGTTISCNLPDFVQIICKIMSNAPGAGFYYARSFGPLEDGTSVTGEDDLTEDMLGSLSDYDDVLFMNPEETGKTTHVLTEDGQTPIGIGDRLYFTAEDPSKMVVRGWSLASVDCSGGGDNTDDGSP